MRRDLLGASFIAPKCFVFVNTGFYIFKPPAMGYKVILTVNKKRPVNLDITTISLPVTGFVSFFHRLSGIFLFAGVAVLLWMLDSSLDSQESFAAVRDMSASPIFKAIVWLVLAALAYHTVAGIRHLIMDFGLGESLKGGQIGAKLVLVISVILIALIGVWLW
jgi:succinate dehydrogenase / fumarate reductase cytochrome b subunit